MFYKKTIFQDLYCNISQRFLCNCLQFYKQFFFPSVADQLCLSGVRNFLLEGLGLNHQMKVNKCGGVQQEVTITPSSIHLTLNTFRLRASRLTCNMHQSHVSRQANKPQVNVIAQQWAVLWLMDNLWAVSLTFLNL